MFIKKSLVAASSMIARRPTKRNGVVVCSAPVPERNRGDQALLNVVVNELRDRDVGPILLLSTSNQPIDSIAEDQDVTIREDLFSLFLTDRCFSESLLFPHLVSRYRHFLVIGADVLDEGYSVMRSKATMDAIQVASRLKLQTRILGFSINGPPSPGLKDRLDSLGRTTRLFARDPMSYKRMEEAGVSGVEQSGDLAFLLKPADESAIDPVVMRFVSDHRDKLIGLNLTEVVFGMYGKTEEKLSIVAEACKTLAEKDGLRFLLLPHDEPEGVEFMRQFLVRLGADADEWARLVAPLPHCSHLKFLAGQCKHVFTARLHLGIATLGMNRPVTGFPYQGKFEGQFGLLGLSSDGLIGPERFPTNVEQMADLMRKRIEKSEELAQTIAENLPNVKRLSRFNFDGIGGS